jgi:hypothetical protein
LKNIRVATLVVTEERDKRGNKYRLGVYDGEKEGDINFNKHDKMF